MPENQVEILIKVRDEATKALAGIQEQLGSVVQRTGGLVDQYGKQIETGAKAVQQFAQAHDQAGKTARDFSDAVGKGAISGREMNMAIGAMSEVFGQASPAISTATIHASRFIDALQGASLSAKVTGIAVVGLGTAAAVAMASFQQAEQIAERFVGIVHTVNALDLGGIQSQLEKTRLEIEKQGRAWDSWSGAAWLVVKSMGTTLLGLPNEVEVANQALDKLRAGLQQVLPFYQNLQAAKHAGTMAGLDIASFQAHVQYLLAAQQQTATLYLGPGDEDLYRQEMTKGIQARAAAAKQVAYDQRRQLFAESGARGTLDIESPAINQQYKQTLAQIDAETAVQMGTLRTRVLAFEKELVDVQNKRYESNLSISKASAEVAMQDVAYETQLTKEQADQIIAITLDKNETIARIERARIQDVANYYHEKYPWFDYGENREPVVSPQQKNAILSDSLVGKTGVKTIYDQEVQQAINAWTLETGYYQDEARKQVAIETGKLAEFKVLRDQDLQMEMTHLAVIAEYGTGLGVQLAAGFHLGLDLIGKDTGTWGLNMADTMQGIGRDMVHGLDQGYFDVVTGRFKNLKNDGIQIMESMLHEITNMFAKQTVRSIFGGLGDMFPLAGSSGGAGAAVMGSESDTGVGMILNKVYGANGAQGAAPSGGGLLSPITNILSTAKDLYMGITGFQAGGIPGALDNLIGVTKLVNVLTGSNYAAGSFAGLFGGTSTGGLGFIEGAGSEIAGLSSYDAAMMGATGTGGAAAGAAAGEYGTLALTGAGLEEGASIGAGAAAGAMTAGEMLATWGGPIGMVIGGLVMTIMNLGGGREEAAREQAVWMRLFRDTAPGRALMQYIDTHAVSDPAGTWDVIYKLVAGQRGFDDVALYNALEVYEGGKHVAAARALGLEYARATSTIDYLSIATYESGGGGGGMGGNYDVGGVIPGPKGKARRVTAHGGEFVLTPDQAEALGLDTDLLREALAPGGLGVYSAMASGGPRQRQKAMGGIRRGILATLIGAASDDEVEALIKRIRDTAAIRAIPIQPEKRWLQALG